MKYKWYIKLLFRSGVIQNGYFESNNSLSGDVFNELMLVGKPITEGNYNTVYTDDIKNASLSYKVCDVTSITISDKYIE